MNSQMPLEDITAIVNRFQTWVGAQADPDVQEGVRELTYDEAIRSRRLRTHLEDSVPEVENSVSVPTQPVRHMSKEKPAKLKKKILPRSKSPRVATPEPVEFRQVLAENISILPADPSKKLALIEHRTKALTLRISSAEHALVKRRADEANLSISSYLRNCVLEVESLRVQMAKVQEEHKRVRVQTYARTSAFVYCLQIVRGLFVRKTTTLAMGA